MTLDEKLKELDGPIFDRYGLDPYEAIKRLLASLRKCSEQRDHWALLYVRDCTQKEYTSFESVPDDAELLKILEDK